MHSTTIPPTMHSGFGAAMDARYHEHVHMRLRAQLARKDEDARAAFFVSSLATALACVHTSPSVAMLNLAAAADVFELVVPHYYHLARTARTDRR